MNAGQRDHERGSATVLVLAGVLASCAVSGLWIEAGRAALARQRAETAADLAALAAAQSVSRHESSACAAAAEMAVRNGARLQSCTLTGATSDVWVVVDAPLAARARARAGPAVDQ